MKATLAVLFSQAGARVIRDVHVERPPYVPPEAFEHHAEIRPLSYHWNEDPHSVPDPISGKKYLTST